jgi:hypothetical protein
MQATAIFVSVLVSVFVSIFLAMFLAMPRTRWTAAQEKWRIRRIADAKMNARLLRLNL